VRNVGTCNRLWLALAVLGVYRSSPALADHTFARNGVGGDCWRPDTPLLCRTSWAGAETLMTIRIIDQLNSAALFSAASDAAANWTAAPGPQSFSAAARPGDSFDYLKRDDNLIAPNGYVWNCFSTPFYCPDTMPSMFVWSEVYVTIHNLDCSICQPPPRHSCVRSRAGPHSGARSPSGWRFSHDSRDLVDRAHEYRHRPFASVQCCARYGRRGAVHL
jgi:hypothetical protein